MGKAADKVKPASGRTFKVIRGEKDKFMTWKKPITYARLTQMRSERK